MFKWTDETSVEEAVGEAIGAGSVCWSNPGGAGIFDSTLATEIVKELMVFLENRFEVKT